MKKVIKGVAGLTLGVGLSIGVMGCNGTNHDSGNPTTDIVIKWWRVETPPSFQTIMFGCFGTTGMYLDQGDGNLSQVQNDQMCPVKPEPYELQERHGSDPASIVGTYTTPPDSTGKYESINGRV
jgi:hypothetical protein